MNVVINENFQELPEFDTQGSVLLNTLILLGYDPLNPPMGELLAKKMQLAGRWAVVSPVYWQATHNDALIQAAGCGLGLDESQMHECFVAYSSFLAEEGMTLVEYDTNYWLLCIDNKPSIHAKPIQRLLNHSLMLELPAIDTTSYWQKFITESQMFFATQPYANSLNGVWVWGAQQDIQRRTTAICTNKHWLSFANLLSSNAVLYTPQHHLKQNDILLLDHVNELSALHQKQLKRNTVSWYWNNGTNTTIKKGYFHRLWRSLIHAH